MHLIPYGHQSIDDQDIAEVVNVLKSDYLTQGPKPEVFETHFCQKVDAKYSIAVSSGTAALHIACLALDLGPDDILWTSPISFVASANCARYCGATVDFVDIDPDTWNISIECLISKLELAKKQNKLPKILVAVHFAGLPCDMSKIKELSSQYGFYVIEDAAHALGASYSGVPIGSCKNSDITIFSFHPIKSITTAEGGMLTTKSRELNNKIRLLRTHGITREGDQLTTTSEGGWYYEQKLLGYNYRLSDIQAALGISQLSRLDEFIQKRQSIASDYQSRLSKKGFVSQAQLTDFQSAWHIFPIKLHKSISTHRKNIFNELRENNIGVNVHYIPIHLQPYYRNLGFNPGDYPNAENYYHGAITLPIYPDLGSEEVNYIIETFEKIISKYI